MNNKKKKGAVHRKNALIKRNSARYRKAKQKKILLLACSTAVLAAVVGVTVGVRVKKHRQEQEDAIIQEEQRQERAEGNTITIGATGSMLLHGPILNSEWYTQDGAHFDFSDIYRYITPYYSAPDFMTCEFEGTLSGEAYSGYPSFFSPDDIIENLADSGVDLQMLATNHLYDGMTDTFHRSMNVYDQKGIAYTGVRQQATDKNYYLADIKNIRVGFIDYVYETPGSDVALNSAPLTTRDQKLINTFDYDELDLFYPKMTKAIQEMKEEGAEYIIANMHWGDEYHLKEAEYQDRMAQKLCNLGVDAIIGGHPHCEQPVDMLESKDGHRMFCIYSVGNALSNQRKELISDMPEGHTEDGVMVTLTLYKDEEDQVSLKDVELLPTWVYKKETEKGNKYYILPLDDVDQLEETTGLSGIKREAQASYDRTMSVLGGGLKKVKSLLEENTEKVIEQ